MHPEPGGRAERELAAIVAFFTRPGLDSPHASDPMRTPNTVVLTGDPVGP